MGIGAARHISDPAEVIMGGAKTRAHALRYSSVYLRRDAIQLAVIEALEDRRLLALVTWDGGGGDLRWDNALNWSGDVTPQSGDDAVVDVPGTIAVTISSDISVRSATVHENLT